LQGFRLQVAHLWSVASPAVLLIGMLNTRRRRRLVVALGLALILGAAAGVSLVARMPHARAERAEAATRLSANRPKSVLGARATARRQMPIPIRISIPAIGVDARVIRLGLNPDRTIQVPSNLADAGWFQPGPEPGERGAAVIVGHLESSNGPGVFHRLRQMRVGGVIEVRLQDRTTLRFVARSMIRVPKSRFPTKLVYARTKEPTLRLVTCAGPLNPSTGHHQDNYIVFATIAP
jgi:sortase (surface protein transpeptidase)